MALKSKRAELHIKAGEERSSKGREEGEVYWGMYGLGLLPHNTEATQGRAHLLHVSDSGSAMVMGVHRLWPGHNDGL
eukprot:scaffold285831_cov19-Tisochrysis_lutea.AAC.1